LNENFPVLSNSFKPKSVSKKEERIKKMSIDKIKFPNKNLVNWPITPTPNEGLTEWKINIDRNEIPLTESN
jgi:hypothetical protein